MVPHRFPSSFHGVAPAFAPAALRRGRLFLAIAALGAVATLDGACDKVPLVAPSGTVITLISGTNALPSNGATDITAVLIESGSTSTGTATTGAAGAGTPVHNGTLVTFTTSLGRIEPVEARTTAGRATVRLLADGRSGVATITAISGGASRTLTVNVGAAAAARILVTASPQALPAVGGTATISARVEDAQGNGLQGVQISFSTSAGSLSAGNALTDANGFATTTLTTAAAATVTASAGGGATGTTLSGTVPITVSPNLALSFSPQSGSIYVSTPMTFTLSVGTTPVVTDVTIDFGDNDRADLGPISGSVTVQHLYGRDGGLSATATATIADQPAKQVTAPVVVLPFTVTVTGPGSCVFTSNCNTTFTATTSPAGVVVADYIWDFGDGTIQSGGSTVQHTWQSRGTKTIKVTVVPAKGSPKVAITNLEVT